MAGALSYGREAGRVSVTPDSVVTAWREMAACHAAACAALERELGERLLDRRDKQFRRRMVTGEPKAVAQRLLEMKQLAQADEIVVVTPSLDRERRMGSYTALADAWRTAA